MAGELTIGQQIVAKLGTRRRGIVDFVNSSLTICQREAPEVLNGLVAAKLADGKIPDASRPATEVVLANTVDRRLALRPADRASAEALLGFVL